jgi:hypothetical protein
MPSYAGCGLLATLGGGDAVFCSSAAKGSAAGCALSNSPTRSCTACGLLCLLGGVGRYGRGGGIRLGLGVNSVGTSWALEDVAVHSRQSP